MSVPVELGRDEARELARRELADPRYDSEPPLFQRIIEWLVEQISRLLDGAAGALTSPAGVVVLVVIIAVIAAIVLRYSPLARRAASRDVPLFDDGRRTARDFRDAAEAAAHERRWSIAVVERFRAIIATLEERGVIDQRPGRTADEAARDAGAALHDLSGELTAAARLFDAVHYGGHEAGPDDDRRMRELDDVVTGTRSRFQAVLR